MWIVELLKHKLFVKGVPLRIDSRKYTAQTAEAILVQIQKYIGRDVIPNLPITHIDDDARKQILEMCYQDLVKMFVEYSNEHNKPNEVDYKTPETAKESLTTLSKMGWVKIISQGEI